MHAHAGPRIVKIYLNGLASHKGHPKHAVRVDVRVEIVDLLRYISRSNWTGIEIESDKNEGTDVSPGVRTDELALTKTHIRRERQIDGRARYGVGSETAAANAGITYEPSEVSDLRWLIYVGQRNTRSRRFVMDEDAEGAKWSNASRNRVGVYILGAFAEMGWFGAFAKRRA
jgi:hypothetical protein